MKSLLVIAYFFPPLGGGGVQRTLGFVRHLPSFGYRPVVLAAAPSVAYWATDETLVDDVPNQVDVHRVADGLWAKSAGLIRRACPARQRARFDAWFLIPDRQAPWFAPALRQARALAATERFSAIYSTGQPWTDHLVAAALAKETGLPWVADFRDPWTSNQQYRPATPLHDRLHRGLESQVYQRADRVIANTAHNERELLRAFPETQGKTLCIPNGFDEERILRLRGMAARPASERLIITYAGSLYPGYGAESFFAAVAAALELAPELRAKLTLRFIGKTAVARSAAEFGLGEILEEPGYLARDEADRMLLEGHVSLAVLPPYEARSGWVPQKLYAYLGLGRPVLALFPEGEAADILRAAGGTHLILDPAQPDPQELAQWLRQRAGGDASAPFDPESVQRFERRALTQRLASALDSLTA